MGKNEVGKCQVRATLIPALVVECAQDQEYQHVRRVCHRRRPVRARMKHCLRVYQLMMHFRVSVVIV